MAADPVQLFSEPDARGRRYTPIERERAFGRWYACRSLAKTASDLNMAENTIRAWAKEDEWRRRAKEVDNEAVEASRHLLASKATDEATKSLDRIISIRDDPNTPAKVALDASIYILGIHGVVVPRVGSLTLTNDANTDRYDDEVIDVQSLIGKSPDELSRIEDSYRAKRRSS